jgi:DnaJ-like protein
MFERGTGDRTEGPVTVEISLEDGQKLQGKLVVPPGRTLTEVLNGSLAFVEFLPIDGERIFIAKTGLLCVKPLAVPSAPKLKTGNGDAGGFDPSAILGVAPGASREEVREAYLHLAKMYHPDRYAAAELPPEVREYLAAMARRINAAYDALHTTAQKRAPKSEPVFTKSGHG